MDRKCTSCGTTDTPKWRCGMTLCNACGLRTCKRIPGHRDDNGMHAQGLGWQGLTPSRLGPYTCFPVYCVACTDRPSAMALPRTSDVLNEHQLQQRPSLTAGAREQHGAEDSIATQSDVAVQPFAELAVQIAKVERKVAKAQLVVEPRQLACDDAQSGADNEQHSMQGMAMGTGMTPGMIPSQMAMCTHASMPDVAALQMPLHTVMPMQSDLRMIGVGMNNVGTDNVGIGNLHTGYQMSSHQSNTSWNGGMYSTVPGGMGSSMDGYMNFMQQRLISQTSGNGNNMMMGRMMPSHMPSSAGMASFAHPFVSQSQHTPQMATAMLTMLPMRQWM